MWAALSDLKQLSWLYQNGFIGDGKFWILIINSEILNSSTAEPVKMTSFKERWFPLRGHTFIMFTENEQFRDLPTPFISKNKQQIYCLETKNPPTRDKFQDDLPCPFFVDVHPIPLPCGCQMCIWQSIFFYF